MHCSQCFSSDIINDPASGSTACSQCGFVLDSSSITSEISFAEGSGGAAHMLGQVVSANQSGIKFSTPMGVTRESREVTLGKARQVITRIATSLHLRSTTIDAAERLYLLALQHGFTRGRSTERVSASCLYAVCRREKFPIMLIDFSESLRTNVYTLGHTYLRLIGCLHLELPLVDPSLYIHRFAHKLDFGKKEHTVSQTALQIVRRMKRDWLHVGRRPSGLCGAALYIAAKLHGFHRDFDEITRVVKICNATLQKRLLEFARLPAAELTSEEFLEADLDSFESQEHPAMVHEEVISAATRTEVMKAAEDELINESIDKDLIPFEYGVEEDLSYLDDEVDQYLATPFEAKYREEMWEILFGHFVKRQKKRRKDAAEGVRVSRKRKVVDSNGQVTTPRALSRIDITAMDDLFQVEDEIEEVSEEEPVFEFNQEYEMEDEFSFLTNF
ncbi:hypothetical protein P9112_008900 [Eukaryota sp. TZLM1-RC]